MNWLQICFCKLVLSFLFLPTTKSFRQESVLSQNTPRVTNTHPCCSHTAANLYPLSSSHPDKNQTSRQFQWIPVWDSNIEKETQKGVLQGHVKHKQHYWLPLKGTHYRNRNVCIKAKHLGSYIAIIFLPSISILARRVISLYIKKEYLPNGTFSCLLLDFPPSISSIKTVNHKIERLQCLSLTP